MADKTFPSQTVRSVTANDIDEIVIKVNGGVVQYIAVNYSLHRTDNSLFKNGMEKKFYNTLGSGAQGRLDTILADAVVFIQNRLDAASGPDQA